MDKPTESLVAWMNDALDAEHSLVRVLDEHADHLELADPELMARVSNLLSRSREHARLLGDAIARLGGHPVGGSAVVGEIKGVLLNIREGSGRDDELRRLIDAAVLAHSLITRYTLIAAGARANDDSETAMTAESILEEKRELVTWIDDHLPQAARTYIEKEV